MDLLLRLCQHRQLLRRLQQAQARSRRRVDLLLRRSACGKAKPSSEVGWTCECGTKNGGKFCAACGKPKPADAPLYRCDKCGWEPEDPANPPKFCPECGDPFDENDLKKD